ncbi:Gfo/Idh/MocA family oxidoreductase [Protofrankia symbiont of Coriaria ruscifolia]|uniref:Thiazolinyl imide reductase n=1 Tax=Candidatus Protofrankia californiensis TaxID=1839754 RepID=A0A1C3PG53_9ACTN|nr:Gfo/Idh/MocA family oxidoreductase [Protofrankia symbiont of Coriaria ruscifolia]SBW28811.1 thiazolinyl imide reductase [Candidatus Protofrankia californiensis]
MTATASDGSEGRPLRVLVCGTNFGRFYATAVRGEPGFTVAGILSRGGNASRTFADQIGVAHYDRVEAVPDGIDLACVVVGSTISGGTGSELARALMGRGVHVLQEHPVHPTEMTASLRLARRHHVQYRVNTHYPHVGPVRSFIAAAQRLRAHQTPVFVDAATPVHVLLPLVDILGRALGGLRPWRFDAVDVPGRGGGPLRTLIGELAGVPVTLRVQNQLDPSDRDNHALLWHRITLGAEGGVLTLADTHGPVQWSPRLHAERDADRRLVVDGPVGHRFDQDSTSVLPGTAAGTQRDIFDRLWPEAIARALVDMAGAIEVGGDPLSSAQYDLTVTRIWSHIAAGIGPPEAARVTRPRPLALNDLLPETDAAGRAIEVDLGPTVSRAPGNGRVRRSDEPGDDADPGPDGGSMPYTPTAEFFDLVAAAHVQVTSAPAVIEALRMIDLGRGPIVEVGAGTGLLTEAVARAFADIEIVAYEPSEGMRAVLASRVYRDDDLRCRVTISADAAPDLELPEAISAALVCGVAGHLDRPARETLWRRLRERLAPRGVIVVELMNLDRPILLEPHRLAQAELGEQSYEWWFSGEPADGDLMRMRSTWRVLREAETVREARDGYVWHTVDLATVAAEAGMDLRRQPGGGRPGATPLGVLAHRALP